MQAYVVRITERDPSLRRIHVVGELHPGELAERGYALSNGEWIIEIRRPAGGKDADPFIDEFRALQHMGYGFAEGGEWSPAELARRFADKGLLNGDL